MSATWLLHVECLLLFAACCKPFEGQQRISDPLPFSGGDHLLIHTSKYTYFSDRYHNEFMMPCFKLFTNLTKSDIPKDFVNKIIPILARLMRKPAENFICMVSTDCQVTFGEQSTLPCAVASLESIGSIGVEDNKLVTKELTEILEKELSIKPDRFFISFYDIKAYNIGKGGIIMSEIYG